MCIIIGVMATNSTPGTLDPYPAGSAIGFINYASTDETCIRKVFTPFMEHMPFILLLQTLVLVIVEKFTFKIPRNLKKILDFSLSNKVSLLLQDLKFTLTHFTGVGDW